MMGRQQSHRHAGEIDEHDQPTEPMPVVPFPAGTSHNPPPSARPPDGAGPGAWPLTPAGAYGEATAADANIPIPQPYEHPFPYQEVPYTMPFASPYAGGQQPAYPMYPPAYGYGARAPGGTPGAYPGADARGARKTTARTRRSSLPVLVGLFFVLVQLLLLARFILILLGFSADTEWVGIIYTFSSLFALPFRILQQHFTPPLPAFPGSIELFTLLAILAYGLFSRILVRLLKALLH